LYEDADYPVLRARVRMSARFGPWSILPNPLPPRGNMARSPQEPIHRSLLRKLGEAYGLLEASDPKSWKMTRDALIELLDENTDLEDIADWTNADGEEALAAVGDSKPKGRAKPKPKADEKPKTSRRRAAKKDDDDDEKEDEKPKRTRRTRGKPAPEPEPEEDEEEPEEETEEEEPEEEEPSRRTRRRGAAKEPEKKPRTRRTRGKPAEPPVEEPEEEEAEEPEEEKAKPARRTRRAAKKDDSEKAKPARRSRRAAKVEEPAEEPEEEPEAEAEAVVVDISALEDGLKAVQKAVNVLGPICGENHDMLEALKTQMDDLAEKVNALCAWATEEYNAGLEDEDDAVESLTDVDWD
jgi:hypothetical protein